MMAKSRLRNRQSETRRAAYGVASIVALVLVVGACNGAVSQPTNDGGRSSADPDGRGQAEVGYLQVTDKAYYSTVREMFDAAEIVILGEVTQVEFGEILSGGANPQEDSFLQNALYTVEVAEVLKGDPRKNVTVVRTSYKRTGDVVRPISFQGVLPNEPGDEVLWFLEPTSDLANVWEQISLDGVLEVKDGLIFSELDRDGGLADRLRGKPVDEVLGTLRALTREP